MIIKSGAKPIKKLPSRKFHEYFGNAGVIPDFNLDVMAQKENQETDGAPTECTGYAISHIVGNLKRQVFTPDWMYAMTLLLEGSVPTEIGADPLTAMQAAIAYGLLPKSMSTFSSSTEGELYCANWKNWPTALRSIAAKNAQIRAYNALGSGSPLDSMLSAAYTGKVGISVASLWYPEFENLLPGSIMPVPDITNKNAPGHNYALDGQTTINGVPYGIISSWQGESYGDKSYCYMSRAVAAAVLSVPGSGALTFGLSGSRWLSLAGIMLEHENEILDLLPTLASLTAQGFK